MAAPLIVDPGAIETLAPRGELPIPPLSPPPRLSGPDPEVPEKAARRRFTAEYKLRILREADRCAEPGALGALLRREGLYSSHLTTWRRQREQGALEALSPRRRGRPASPAHPLVRRIAELERDTTRLQERLRQAEAIIAAQKKLSEILGLPLPTPAAGDLA
jgi:transposase-like protein